MSEVSEITNREHDQIAGIKKVTLFPASSQRMIDTTSSTITYVGVAAAGKATSASKSWLIEKIDTTSSTLTIITHATDSWDNRASASFS